MLYKFFHFASQTADLQAKSKIFHGDGKSEQMKQKTSCPQTHVEKRWFLCCYADVLLVNDVKRENKNRFAEISRETSPK